MSDFYRSTKAHLVAAGLDGTRHLWECGNMAINRLLALLMARQRELKRTGREEQGAIHNRIAHACVFVGIPTQEGQRWCFGAMQKPEDYFKGWRRRINRHVRRHLGWPKPERPAWTFKTVEAT